VRVSRNNLWCRISLENLILSPGSGSWWGTGTGCPGRWWSHCPWRCSRNVEMWHWGTWFSGHNGGGLMVELEDISGLFQPSWFYEMGSWKWIRLLSIEYGQKNEMSVPDLFHSFSCAMENHGKNFLVPSSYAAQHVNLCCHRSFTVLKPKSKKQWNYFLFSVALSCFCRCWEYYLMAVGRLNM